MTNQLTVNEFSRKLLEPKKVPDKWVSTGFDREIGLRTNANLKVPIPIQNAVNNHCLRINDNYPPAEGEIALIALEIEQDAILAVANRLADDSDRPFVGYRYFWLEKPSETEIDAVGTLLKWWLDHNKPCFELKPHQEIEDTQRKNHKAGYYHVAPYQANIFEEYRQEVEDIIPQITHTPHIFTLKEKSENSGVPDYLELHSLALYLKQEYNQPIAWVWNITALENPDQFNLICCADEKSKKWNLEDNKVLKPLSKSTTTTTGNDKTLLKSAIQNLKNRFNQDLVLIVAEGLISKNVNAQVWESLFNAFRVSESNSDESSARFFTLRAILVPQTLPNLLTWLNQKKNQQFQEQSRQFQRQILNIFTKHPQSNSQKIEALQQNLDGGLKVVLETLVKGQITVESVLLLHLCKSKRTIWSKSLDNWGANIQDNFTYIAKDKQSLSRNSSSFWGKYYPLAIILSKIATDAEAYKAAAFLYQISQGKVPHIIFRSAFPSVRKNKHKYCGITLEKEPTQTEITLLFVNAILILGVVGVLSVLGFQLFRSIVSQHKPTSIHYLGPYSFIFHRLE